MVLSDVLPVIETGSVFIIKTEKTVELAAGAPSRYMNKISEYSISLKIGVVTPTWWVFSNKHPNIAVKKSSGREYLLCKMASVVFGSSNFFAVSEETGDIDESKSYSKRDIAKWLPPAEPFIKDTVLTLPLDGIQSLELYVPKAVVKPVGVAEPAELQNMSAPFKPEDYPFPAHLKTQPKPIKPSSPLDIAPVYRRSIIKAVMDDLKRSPKERLLSDDHINKVITEYLPVWEGDLPKPSVQKPAKKRSGHGQEPYTIPEGIPHGF